MRGIKIMNIIRGSSSLIFPDLDSRIILLNHFSPAQMMLKTGFEIIKADAWWFEDVIEVPDGIDIKA